MRNKWLFAGVAAGIVTVIATILCFVILDIHTVHGNEIGVKETWSSGVDPRAYGAKTYILFPGFNQEIYNYPINVQKYVMNDESSTSEKSEGREKDLYRVESKEGQPMNISMALQYQLDPLKIVELHKTVRDDWQEKIIRPTTMRVVKDKATVYEAMVAYSGEGLVKLQSEIQQALKTPLAEKGIILDNFVIEKIDLDPKYVEEIKQRQVSMQAELRAKQEEKTALAMANKAKAEAQSEYERALVKAKQEKEVAVTKAQQEAEQKTISAEASSKQTIIAAEASAKQTVVAAQADKDASELKASAILAQGKAEAESKKLMFGAYAAPGADSFVKIEVSKNLATAFSGVKGFIPSNMNINSFSTSFMDGIKGFMGEKVAPATNESK